MQRRSYCNTVFPTVHTRIGGLCASSLYIVYPDVPDGVVSSQGCSFVPLTSAIVTSSLFGRWSVFSIIYWSLQYVKQSNWFVTKDIARTWYSLGKSETTRCTIVLLMQSRQHESF